MTDITLKDEKTAVEQSSLRKPRPLPKIPQRDSSKQMPSLPRENLLGQGKLSAQQIFQIMNFHSGQQADGVFAFKTEIPVDPNVLHWIPPKKLMTPVIEVDEESEEYMSLFTDQNSSQHVCSNTGTPSLTSEQTSPSLVNLPTQEKKDTFDDISTLDLNPTIAPIPVRPESLSFDVQNLSFINDALMTPMFQPSIEQNPFSISPAPTMTSFSLIHDKDSIKTYRRMATKTHDSQIQFSYAKYLIQLVSFYASNNQTDNQAISIASAQTRNRLQEEAEYWIDRLSKANHPEALYIKGHWHRFGKHTVGSQYKKVNHLKAFKSFQQSAKLGYAEACYELAEYYVIQKEFKKAISSYKLAASKKHVLSLYKMANILLRGLLCQEEDVHQGLAFLKGAADSGNTQDSARSAYDLGCIYSRDLESIGLERNAILSNMMSDKHIPLAIGYFKKADEIGLAVAAFQLGKIYEHGLLGMKKDIWEAYRYYTKASEMKCHEAMLELSGIYMEGIPGYLNAHPVMAFKWCQYAVEDGNEVAEYTLGCYYEEGIGVSANYPQALEWFSKSASKGYKPAEEKLNIPLNKRKGFYQSSRLMKSKRYYDESIRIAELSREKKAEIDCHM